MNRRRVVVPLVILAIVGAATGIWLLYPQRVSFEAYYPTSLAGTTVAILVDGNTVGAFVVPNIPPSNGSCIMFTGCPKTLGDAWLAKGLHTVRVTMNGTIVLEQPFAVTDRNYAWVAVYATGHADFGIASDPPAWL